MIKWACNEEKAGWRVTAVLPLPGDVRIESDVLIGRKEMREGTMQEVISRMQFATNVRREAHEAGHA